jgi:hypothetical protein
MKFTAFSHRSYEANRLCRGVGPLSLHILDARTGCVASTTIYRAALRDRLRNAVDDRKRDLSGHLFRADQSGAEFFHRTP